MRKEVPDLEHWSSLVHRLCGQNDGAYCGRFKHSFYRSLMVKATEAPCGRRFPAKSLAQLKVGVDSSFQQAILNCIKR